MKQNGILKRMTSSESTLRVSMVNAFFYLLIILSAMDNLENQQQFLICYVALLCYSH